MAVDDEARARAVLGEMQTRISQGPHVALGVDDASATPEIVRAAFLQLTKQFHPARFGRMSTELQRLSNEVFLGIKAAHEQMLRSLGVMTRGSTMQTGGMPVLAAEGTNRIPRVGAPQPRAVGTGQPVQPAQQPAIAVPRTLTPTKHGIGVPPAARPPNAGPGTPAFGVRTVARPGTPPQAPGLPPVRPGTPPQAGGSATGLPRAGTPPQAPPGPQTSQPPAAARPGTPQAAPLPRTTPGFDERAELQQVLDALAQKNWGAAKALLNGLAARVPASKQYRALLAFTRGREAQTAGRGEDAVMEFQRALQLDPDLQQAKSAMAELLRRR